MNLSITRLEPIQKANCLQNDGQTHPQNAAQRHSLSGLHKDTLSISFGKKATFDDLVNSFNKIYNEHKKDNKNFNENEIIKLIKEFSARLLDPANSEYHDIIESIKYIMYKPSVNNDTWVNIIDALFSKCSNKHLTMFLESEKGYRNESIKYLFSDSRYAKTLADFLKRLKGEGIPQAKLNEILEFNKIENKFERILKEDGTNLPGLMLFRFDKISNSKVKNKLREGIIYLRKTLKDLNLEAKYRTNCHD